ncbi:YCF48-related protein [Ignavibacterium sp.]|uniref:T9SS type A sorting domain-containing protein n=1 Tax=Ignavibacterium sp. TaxID=2651167 RepID=UPI0021FD61D0|nr:YCF48-related protein [Ignavibacterium sp.]BDQ04156.1 MAG: hypothetical protein KatS3mg037_2731 [Ignavibacterium sp.]
MKRILTLVFIICLFKDYSNSQQLVWKHTGGPMGGIVGDLAINSLGEIYAGVYPDWNVYSGLYKSTDNGNSWFKIETQFEDFEVYAIYITKEDHIWVGTNFQGRIYLSTDNGKTWENRRTGYNTGECWAFGQSKDGVMFAGDGQYGKLYRSTDYGNNWIFSANLRPLVFATDSNNIVYAGTHNGLFATTDNGLTWAQNNFLSTIPVSSILIDSANNIYCGTGYYDNGNGVFYSTDGGQNWTQLGLAGKIVLSLAFDSKGDLYAGTKEDGLYKTTDLGQTWEQYKRGLYRKQVFRLKLNKQGDIFIGSENEGVFRSTNNGNSFEHIGLPISRVKNIVFSGDSLIFTSTPSGVQKYNRITKRWTNMGLQNVEAISMSPSNYLYAATFDEGLFKSTDLGKSWQLTNLTADTLMSVYNVLVASDDTLFASTEFKLRKSTDGGISWNILPIITHFFSRTLIIKNKSLFCTGFNFISNNETLYKSKNLGNSFDSLFSGFNLPDENNVIAITDNNYVFISDPFLKGILRSTDGGNNFEQILFNKYTYSVFAKDNGLVITDGASFGGQTDSVYISTNFGNSWIGIDKEIGLNNYLSDIKEDASNKLFFGTRRTGLYEIDIITSMNEDVNNLSKSFQLFHNYPNPFNPSTKISWRSPVSGRTTLKVYDVLGREVATLVDEYREAGNYEVEFNVGQTFSLSALSSGVYFYKLTIGEFTEVKKMILTK